MLSEAASTIVGVLQGVDVSQHQGNIDWSAVKAAGVDFAICKASEGEDFRDSRWSRARVAAVREAGLELGVYHFLRPRAGRLGDVEAEFAVKTARAAGWGKRGDLPLAVDVEVTDLHGGLATRRYVRQFVRRYHELTGHWPIFYSFPSFIDTAGFGSWLARRCPLWLADLGAAETDVRPWRAVTIRQHSFGGHVAGIPGDVDLDRAAKLPRVPAPKPVVVPHPDPTPLPTPAPLTRRQKLIRALRRRRARWLDTRTDAALKRYLFAKARVGRWDKRYCLHFGVDPNVSPDCKAFITRAFAHGLVATSTTGGQHAAGSFHFQKDAQGRGRGADVGNRRGLIGTAEGRRRMESHQHHEFGIRGRTRPVELLGPINDRCILRGSPTTLGEGTALEDMHDTHVHFGK